MSPLCGRLFFMEYNIFSELKRNLAEFEEEIDIVQPQSEGTLRFGKHTETGYRFNQRDTLDTIDMMYNSKYKSGKYDSEGERKTFLNEVKFASEVSRMQTDIDIKNFLFIPDSYEHIDKVDLMKRQFTVWSRENQYGQVINDLNTDYSKYGTCVAKKVGERMVRVPLRKLRNTQDAESLDHAAKTGGFVIEEHTMTANEINEYPDWNVSGIKLGLRDKLTVYERYSLVPLSTIKEFNGDRIEAGDDTVYVLAMQILAPDAESMQLEDGEQYGNILFIEEVDALPYEEAHWDKQDGRWLGIGCVEDLFENQIAKNLTANLRRRALLWGAKKIFQTMGDTVVKNLVKEVRDGAVLEVGKNGEISQIQTASQHIPEFANDDNVWDANTKQRSFTFEVTTGESMPSSTPFRLGVLLSNAAQTRFGLKRENFGFFLERAFFNQQIPIFKKQTKEHIIAISQGVEGMERLRRAMVTQKTNQLFMDRLLDKNMERSLETLSFDFDAIFEEVENKIEEEEYFFVNVPDKFYDDAKFYLQLEITGEGTDVQKEIETLVTVWQTLVQQQDPRSERLLEVIVSKTGMNLQGVLGKKSNNTLNGQIRQIEGEVAANPQLQALANPTNGQGIA